jgi:hypothetical protein
MIRVIAAGLLAAAVPMSAAKATEPSLSMMSSLCDSQIHNTAQTIKVIDCVPSDHGITFTAKTPWKSLMPQWMLSEFCDRVLAMVVNQLLLDHFTLDIIEEDVPGALQHVACRHSS